MTLRSPALRMSMPGRIASYAILGVLLVFALVPTYWMVSSAFKSDAESASITPTLFPHAPTLEQFIGVLSDDSFLRPLVFSVAVAVCTVLITLMIAVSGAYAVTHLKIRGTRFLILAILGSQLLPASAIVVPIYLLWSNLGLVGHWYGLVMVQITVSTPVGMWLLVGFLRSVPLEITEAGRIDGASDFRILVSIIVPLSKPG